MVLILDGNSEHVVRVLGNQVLLKKDTNLRLLSIRTNSLKKSNYRFHLTHGYVFLSNYPILVAVIIHYTMYYLAKTLNTT